MEDNGGREEINIPGDSVSVLLPQLRRQSLGALVVGLWMTLVAARFLLSTLAMHSILLLMGKQ